MASEFFCVKAELINGGHLARISGRAAKVYVAIVSHADSDGECWPSVPRLARLTGYCRRTVLRGIAELEGFGLISVSRESGTPNKYRCQFCHKPVTQLSRVGDQTSDSPVTRPVTDLSPDPCQDCHPNKTNEQIKRTRGGEKRHPPPGEKNDFGPDRAIPQTKRGGSLLDRCLDLTDDARKAWSDWVHYVFVRDGRINEIQLDLQAADLLRHYRTQGEPFVVEAIGRSIRKGSRGDIYWQDFSRPDQTTTITIPEDF